MTKKLDSVLIYDALNVVSIIEVCYCLLRAGVDYTWFP